ncbi:MAG: hypothetical protein GY884_34825 [Proteobacteria bacterium]|nr:hypothetical protein [Pseudomonadota bacterium]
MPHPTDPSALIERLYPQLAAIARGQEGFQSLPLLWHQEAAAEREGMALVVQMATLQQLGLLTDEQRRTRGLLSQLSEIGLAIGEALDELGRAPEVPEPSEPEPLEPEEPVEVPPEPVAETVTEMFDHPVAEPEPEG